MSNSQQSLLDFCDPGSNLCVTPRAITVRTPLPSAGIIDIPIVEKKVQGQQQHHKVGESPPWGMGFCLFLGITSWFLWLQMTLAPSYRMDNGKMVKVRANRDAHVAVTQYQVLCSTPSSALVELQPVTGEDAPPLWGDHRVLPRAVCWILPFFWATDTVYRLRVQLTCVTLYFLHKSETRVPLEMIVGSRIDEMIHYVSHTAWNLWASCLSLPSEENTV